jgi:hypothetical protein
MKRHLIGALLFACWCVESPASTNTQTGYVYQPVLNQDFVVPKVLVDPRTKISYFLDSDGRHISAIDPAAKLLWRADPFVDSKLESYRNSHPIILDFQFVDDSWWKIHSYLGRADGFLYIAFNSSQFGVVRKSNGRFIFFGQD